MHISPSIYISFAWNKHFKSLFF